jgi:hypothetical protein
MRLLHSLNYDASRQSILGMDDPFLLPCLDCGPLYFLVDGPWLGTGTLLVTLLSLYCFGVEAFTATTNVD